jgi:exonuclease SbcD
MKILHFADLHLGVETYGHINPETGLPTRLEDYLKVLDELVDYAIGDKIDLVLFAGDAYKSREPSQTQQREFAKRIKRLSESGIPLFLLIGNHDLPNALGRATTIEIFDTLSIPGVYVANRPGIHKIDTRSGIIQVAALPWLRRSALLTKEDTRNLDFNGINERLQKILSGIIADLANRIDRALPSILAAHVWVLNAIVGSEKSMSIGQEHMLLLGNVAQPAFDYIALGHIHNGQVLSENPPVVYSGSLERLDFGDEDEKKGFYLVEIDEARGGSHPLNYSFHAVNARRFFTLRLDIRPDDPDPTSTLLGAIEAERGKIKDSITRIAISIPSSLSGRLRDSEIRNAAKDAYYLAVSRDIHRENRLRMGKGTFEGITPEDALKAYLETKYPAERARVLLEYGQKLIREIESSK